MCAVLPLLLWVGQGLAFPQARAEFLQEKWPQIRPVLGPFFAAARGTSLDIIWDGQIYAITYCAIPKSS